MNWIGGYYRLYDDWIEPKKSMIHIRIEWSLSWMFLIGVSMSPIFRICLLGFDITFHRLKKRKRYWGKKTMK